MFYFLIGAATFVVLLIVLVQLFKGIISNSSSKILANGAEHDALTKKFPDVDLSKFSKLFTAIGLVISLGITLMAFEWKTYDEVAVVNMNNADAAVEEVIEIPPTQQTTPPPPKIVQPEIVEVPNEEVVEDMEVDLNVEVNQQTVVQQQPKVQVVKEEAPVAEEEVDQIFTIVEEAAEPTGGMTEFLKYVGKTMKYPSQARRMGVEGKVYVEFIIDKDGSITNVKSVKGIGAGCDEEAVRVIQEAPKWKPGKQRGRPVKQKIVIPIAFKLG
ncbi:MAG: TonB family protein [Bernardetiaceae bacterium]|jgi:protein TonB|nr:TonB family protein [Bernardetiaceae bacterium]